ncbi:hypothetical protein [Allomuricauda sp. SCSIO 65647]|uniref:hypothetical protein n=1 Tax=Allomuricauda sp. SCSIO 65647 TaxID=2908843 RepID=UPI001F30C240|nr:hypothetical protein [Muricauda sp. SCSIO 65647]UJH66550.1 hypothetical protein L0P89_11325 [Muricauda sp. SCSIO 65647]
MKEIQFVLKRVISLCVILASIAAVGQTQGSGISLNGQINTSQYNTTRLSNLIFEKFLDQKEKVNPIKFEDIKGSPYEPKEFVVGTFHLKDKEPLNLMMRYNMYDDEIEVKENDGTITSFLKVDGTEFSIQDALIRPYSYTDENDQFKRGNFVVLADGDTKLLLKKKVVLIPPEKAPTPNQRDRAAKFIVNKDYYVLKGTEQPVLFNGKKKDLLSLFPDRAEEIKKFIKEGKLNLKKQEDLAQVFEHINS